MKKNHPTQHCHAHPTKKKVVAHFSHGVWIDNNCKKPWMWWKKGKHFLGGPTGYKCTFLHLFENT
jgi:hypothetical protein